MCHNFPLIVFYSRLDFVKNDTATHLVLFISLSKCVQRFISCNRDSKVGQNCQLSVGESGAVVSGKVAALSQVDILTLQNTGCFSGWSSGFLQVYIEGAHTALKSQFRAPSNFR